MKLVYVLLLVLIVLEVDYFLQKRYWEGALKELSDNSGSLLESFESMSGIHRETVDQLQLSMKIAQENEKWMINIEHVYKGQITDFENKIEEIVETRDETQKKFDQCSTENKKLKIVLDKYKQDNKPISKSSSEEVSLLISMITIPREVNYFKETVSDLLAQCQRITRIDKVSALLVNLRKGEHVSFNQQRNVQTDCKLIFEEISQEKRAIEDKQGIFGKITKSQLQLNYDFHKFIKVTYDTCLSKEMKYVLLLEDDFEWCEGSLQQIFSLIRHANSKNRKGNTNLLNEGDLKWSAIRTSVGMNGLILHCSDFPFYLSLAEENQDIAPLDTIFGQAWSEKSLFQNREYLIYRFNLFNHIGKISAKGGEYNVKTNPNIIKYSQTPNCFEMIKYVGLLLPEYFQDECLHSLFTPCPKELSQ